MSPGKPIKKSALYDDSRSRVIHFPIRHNGRACTRVQLRRNWYSFPVIKDFIFEMPDPFWNFGDIHIRVEETCRILITKNGVRSACTPTPAPSVGSP